MKFRADVKGKKLQVSEIFSSLFLSFIKYIYSTY